MKRQALLVFIFSTPPLLWAGSFNGTGRGSAAAGFLEMGVNARAVAMGEAYSAVADEASAMYWNPGALTRVEKRSVTAMHAASLDSSYFDYGAFAQNLGPLGAWGASFHYYSPGDIVQTDDATGRDIGKFTPYDLALAAGYAYNFYGYSAGVAAKLIQSKITLTDNTGAVDFGVISPGFLDDKLRLAFTASNLGGRIKFERESARLPFALRLGGAYKILPRWTAALDAGFPNDNNPYVALGTEYLLSVGQGWSLAGRLGFNSRTIGDVTGVTGFSAGVGLGAGSLSVDYGFVPYGGAGNSHRMSLSAKF